MPWDGRGVPHMIFGMSTRLLRRTMPALLTGFVVGAAPPVASAAQDAPGPAIYSCRTEQGTRIVDRPVAGCIEQWELNRDGSRKRQVKRQQSDEERAQEEEQLRQEDKRRTELQAKARSDQLLVNRFPNREKHEAARREALEVNERAIATSMKRIEQLKKERKPLMDEAEFYPPPKTLPFKLKNALDANDAALEGQQALIVNQQAERARIDKRFDEQLEELKLLWARQRRAP